jgi:hypothetical protein
MVTSDELGAKALLRQRFLEPTTLVALGASVVGAADGASGISR